MVLSPELVDARQSRTSSPDNRSPAARELYRVIQGPDGALQVELSDEGVLRQLESAAPPPPAESIVGQREDQIFFVARNGADGTYSVTLTEDGVRRFETALGIAQDLGRHSTISPYSTLADVMERTATRDELSDVMRRGRNTLALRLRERVLRRKLRGSERPSAEQSTLSRVGKALLVCIFGTWALLQFVVALQDIQAIPGILANIPNDIWNLQPFQAFGQVGNNIDDAGAHVMMGVLGGLATYVAAKVVRPLGRIYRKDQIIPGERLTLSCLAWTLRGMSE